MTLQYLAPTKRKKMTKARAARIFTSRNGICFNCETQIMPGEDWFIEHPEQVSTGGSDDDRDLWPSHTRCKPEKDAKDKKAKAKRDRLITKSWADRPRPKASIQSRGFSKAKPQNSTRKPEKWTAI
jgi:hypothetical protein